MSRAVLYVRVCVTVQVKARNASAEVIYRTRHVNMSRAAADTCDILPSALPAGNCLPRVPCSYSCVGGVVSAHMRWAFEHVRDRKSSICNVWAVQCRVLARLPSQPQSIAVVVTVYRLVTKIRA